MQYLGMEVIKVPLYKKVQARKHKQKRINKKWLKKYGTKMVQTRPETKNFFMAFNKLMVPEELWDVFIKSVKVNL